MFYDKKILDIHYNYKIIDIGAFYTTCLLGTVGW